MNNSHIFLTSSVHAVAHHIGKKLGAKKKHQKLLFIDTAAEVGERDKQWLLDDRQALVNAGFIVTDYTITNESRNNISKAL